MIEFKVTIRQVANGKISCQCETFPGTANMAEHDVAHEFMKMFREWTCKGRGLIITDWKGTNDTNRN